MPKINTQIQDIDQALSLEQPGFTNLPTMAAPFTTVVNRAQVVNFAADGLPKFGIDRVAIHAITELQSEFGPNGERVWRPINDMYNQVRMIGNWLNLVDANGQFALTSTANDTCEITFYGTGLNLVVVSSTSRDWRVTIDGGAESADIAPDQSTVLNSRNYCANLIIPVASGLTAGMHTVRVRNVSGANLNLCGFEVINTAATIFLPSTTSHIGGRRLAQSSTGTTALNSGFESGTLGTRGGHVLIYQKSDGTIAKAVTPTNASAAFLASADHTNEEVQRVYHWREFGAGRSDDFSLGNSAIARAFTLDDGTTTLSTSLGGTQGGNTEFLAISGSSHHWTLTFVGTGLDFVRVDSSNGTLDQHTVLVDGTSVGTFTGTGSTNQRIQKICSGLPYGTHTVRMTRDAFVNAGVSVIQFIVYTPRTPALPAGALALADYFVMADYAITSSSNYPFVSQGVLHKYIMREFITTASGLSVNPVNQPFPHGGANLTSSSGQYAEYVFFGTGVEFYTTMSAGQAASLTVLVDGLALNAGSNVGSTVTLTVGTTTVTTGVAVVGITLSAAGVMSGAFSTSGQPVLIRISGLALGRHTIRVTNDGATLGFNCVGIITPIHTPKEVGPARLQNVSLIGSSAIRDLRQFAPQQIPAQKAWCQAVGVTSGPSNPYAATVLGPAPDLSTVIKTTGNPIAINAQCTVVNSTAAFMRCNIFVNGVQVGTPAESYLSTGTANITINNSVILYLPAGTHKIDAYWSTNTGTMTGNGNNRQLNVQEL